MTAVIEKAPVTTQAAQATAAPAVDEAKAADLLTFKIGMAVIAAVIAVMAVVGAVISSAALLIAAGLAGTVAAMVGVYTGINLMAA